MRARKSWRVGIRLFCGAPAGPTGWRPDRLLVSVCVCARESLGTARHTLTWVIIGRQDVVNLYTLCTLTSGRRISVFFSSFSKRRKEKQK
jgi:hypothetical protein